MQKAVEKSVDSFHFAVILFFFFFLLIVLARNSNYSLSVGNYSLFETVAFLNSEILSPVCFLKKRLSVEISSNPSISAISLALFLEYSNKRLISVSVLW